VWDVLTDFSAYHEWNPYMKIEGTPQVGTKLTVHIMGAGGGRGTVFKPAVLAATPDKELRWLGNSVSVGLSTASTSSSSTATPTATTHLTHGERYSGALVALGSPS